MFSEEKQNFINVIACLKSEVSEIIVGTSMYILGS